MVDYGYKQKSLKNFTELEILVHCLYEMTFVGFEEKDIKQGLESLESTAKDYEIMSKKKFKKTTSCEEFLNGLKEDEQEN